MRSPRARLPRARLACALTLRRISRPQFTDKFMLLLLLSGGLCHLAYGCAS